GRPGERRGRDRSRDRGDRARPPRVTRMRILRAALVGGLFLVVACPPTLSSPRSEPFAQALAEGERHARHGRDEEAAASFARASELAERRVDREEARYRQARALQDAGELDEAMAALESIAVMRPIS